MGNQDSEQCQVSPPNPVHQHSNGKWYFSDETWFTDYGPFDSEELAIKACAKYAEEQLGIH